MDCPLSRKTAASQSAVQHEQPGGHPEGLEEVLRLPGAGQGVGVDAGAADLEGPGDDGDDPRAIRKVLREMGSEMGEDFEQDFDEMMEEETTE